MKILIILNYILIFLLNFSLESSEGYNFGKYKTYSTRQKYAIFDPTGFNIGDTMYFKITAKFNDDYLYYIYLDTLENLNDKIDDEQSNNWFYVKEYNNVEDEDDDEEIKYFKIVKNKDDIGELEGKYLILIFDCTGRVEIENTEDDEGKKVLIYSIVFSVVGIVIIAIIAYFCCFRNQKCPCSCKKSNEENVKNKQTQINVYQKENEENQMENIKQNYNNQNIQNNNYNTYNNYRNYNNNKTLNINKSCAPPFSNNNINPKGTNINVNNENTVNYNKISSERNEENALYKPSQNNFI